MTKHLSEQPILTPSSTSNKQRSSFHSLNDSMLSSDSTICKNNEIKRKSKSNSGKNYHKRIMYRNYVLGTRNTLTVKKKVFISELLIEEYNNESENQKINPMSRKQVFVNLFKIYKRADKLPNLI